MIWLAGGILAMVAAIAVAFPWLSQLPKAIVTNRRANIVAYQTRLRELDAEAAAGVLAPEALERSKQELAARAAHEAEGSAGGVEGSAGGPSWKIPAALAAVLVAFGATWYGLAGSWKVQALVDLAQIDEGAARKVALEQQVQQLKDRVKHQPDDADSWTWLGRGLQRLEQYPDAAAAFARANQLKGGQDLELMVDEASMIAHTDPGQAAQRFAQVLQVAPNDTRALWFAGALAMQTGDSKGALGYWDRLLKQDLPPEVKAAVEHGVGALRKQLGIAAPVAEAAPAGALRLSIQVTLAPDLRQQLKPGDALFVFAQAAGGPPMPLAVQKLPASGFPVSTSLDDSNSVMPTRKLSSTDHWRLVARVSHTGSAQPQPGDLEGSQDVSLKGAGKTIHLGIDRVLR